MCRRNTDHFAELIAYLINDGWDWTDGHPIEDDLMWWACRGRVNRVLMRADEDTGASSYEYIHLYRGRRALASSRYDRQHTQIGEWYAWVEVVSDLVMPSHKQGELSWI